MHTRTGTQARSHQTHTSCSTHSPSPCTKQLMRMHACRDMGLCGFVRTHVCPREWFARCMPDTKPAAVSDTKPAAVADTKPATVTGACVTKSRRAKGPPGCLRPPHRPAIALPSTASAMTKHSRRVPGPALVGRQGLLLRALLCGAAFLPLPVEVCRLATLRALVTLGALGIVCCRVAELIV